MSKVKTSSAFNQIGIEEAKVMTEMLEEDDIKYDQMTQHYIHESADKYNLEEMVLQELAYKELYKQIDRLDAELKYVTIQYFGLGTEAKSVEDIAGTLNISTENVLSMKEEALRRLKLYCAGLKEYV